MSPTNTAPLGVVILDLDGRELVQKCILTLANQTVHPARIAFVDNGSREFDEMRIRSLFGPALAARTTFVRFTTNQGYAKGMNAGIAALMTDAEVKWVMTLNNDTELAEDFVEKFQTLAASTSSNTGSICPKVFWALDRRILDATGILISLDGMSTARGQNQEDRNQYDRDLNVIAPNGVAAIYRVQMLQSVGLLDEAFESYCEDTDLGLRAWLWGWDCVYAPRCRVFHVRSATLGRFNPYKVYLVERNHYWVAIKSFPLLILFCLPFFTMYRFLLQSLALLLKRGANRGFGEKNSIVALATSTLRGTGSAIRGTPNAILARRSIQAGRKRPWTEVIFRLWNSRLTFFELILK